jgi:trk system potassium uptake protein TrkH
VGETIGSSGNWQSVPKAAKWLLSFEMIVGRLELFPVFILFTPSFWKE